MRKVERYINNIMIDGVLVHKEKMTGKDERGSNWENNWVEIEPKYYIDKSDDIIFEIWYDKTGIILDRGSNTHLKNDVISTDWAIKRFEEINKESAMIKYNERLLRKEQRLVKLDSGEKQKLVNYNNKNLMQRDEPKYKIGDILKVIGGHDREIGTLFKVKDCMTRYRAEDVELYTGLLTTNEEINIYNQSILDIKFEEAKNAFINGQWIKSIRGTMKSIGAKNYVLEDDLQSKQNNGGSSDWYLLPDNAKTLQDLIEHRNMNGAVKDMFKACYRLGIKTEDELRDLNKTAYYALREIGRVSGRKDYITIAKELIGSQAIEKE